MSRRLGIVLTVLMAFFLVSCAKTSITIKTKPSGAKVMLINQEGKQKGRVISDTNFEVKNKEDFFSGGAEHTSVLLLATKEGYKPRLKRLSGIKKGKKNENTSIVNLQRLSTDVSIETSPPGATIKFLDGRGSPLKFLSLIHI